MSDSPNDRTPPPTYTITGLKSEAGASGLNVAAAGWFATWFVPPLIVPACLALLIAARAIYVAYQ
jgi:hypothetical protein